LSPVRIGLNPAADAARLASPAAPIIQILTGEPPKKNPMQEQNRRKMSKLLFQKTTPLLA
jgi:hypothetical protein